MHQPSLWADRVTLPPLPASVAAARDFSCAGLVAHDRRALVDDVRTVVSELATNAIRHARTPFTLTLEELLGRLVIAVTDGSSVLPRLYGASASDVAGRGLVIVATLAVEWGVTTSEPDAKTVWAAFATTAA